VDGLRTAVAPPSSRVDLGELVGVRRLAFGPHRAGDGEGVDDAWIAGGG
jgi:hypothetical protein